MQVGGGNTVGTLKIALLMVTGNVIGALACGTASTGVNCVRTRTEPKCEPLLFPPMLMPCRRLLVRLVPVRGVWQEQTASA